MHHHQPVLGSGNIAGSSWLKKLLTSLWTWWILAAWESTRGAFSKARSIFSLDLLPLAFRNWNFPSRYCLAAVLCSLPIQKFECQISSYPRRAHLLTQSLDDTAMNRCRNKKKCKRKFGDFDIGNQYLLASTYFYWHFQIHDAGVFPHHPPRHVDFDKGRSLIEGFLGDVVVSLASCTFSVLIWID